MLVAVNLLVFHIGFMIFEYGQSRKKNKESALLKHLFLLSSSGALTFLLGFALSYGNPDLMGTKYFLSIKILKTVLHPENEEVRSMNYLTLILSMAVTSSVAVSSINER